MASHVGNITPTNNSSASVAHKIHNTNVVISKIETSDSDI